MQKLEQSIQRRSFERIPSNIQVKFFHGNSVYFGTVTNISENGMFIKTKNIFFPPHSQFEILILSNNEVLNMPVKVSRLELKSSINYGMGVELLNTPRDYLGSIRVMR